MLNNFYIKNTYSQYINCLEPYYLHSVGGQVKCGRCYLCISSWRSRWSLQLYLESLYHKNSCFVTLTYDEPNLLRINNIPSLDDHQRFLKRLRSRLDRLGLNKISFVAVSENGTKNTCRVHYHYIIYGLGFGAFEKKLIEECWTNGFIKVKPVCPRTASYVMKYALKGIKKSATGHFFTYSRGFGLGFRYVDQRRDHFLNQYIFKKSMHIFVNGIQRFLPKNLIKRIFGDDKESYQSYFSHVIDVLKEKHRLLREKKKLDIVSYYKFFRESLYQKVLNLRAIDERRSSKFLRE